MKPVMGKPIIGFVLYWKVHIRMEYLEVKGKTMLGNTRGNSRNADLLSIILGIYVVLVSIGLPLIVKDKYFDILNVKYYYYCFCTIAMVVAVSICFLMTDGKLELLRSPRNRVIDCAVLIYYFITIISTITSDYLYESFWGNEGRYTGLFLTTWYVTSYFCISRFWKYKKYYIDLILGAGMLVCLFGITDYFKMDIFRFKILMVEEQKSIFTSTLGNINTYTSYVGIIMAIATTLFVTAQEQKRIILYYLCMIISFFAIIMGVSDNAYLSLAALFGFLPLYIFSDKRGIQRYLIVLATFFSIVQVIDWINIHFEDTVLGIDSVFNMIVNFGLLPYLLVVLWGLSTLWYVVDRIAQTGPRVYGNKFRYIWLVLIFIIFFSALYALYDCNVLKNTGRYGKVGAYFIFNDEWGSHRGYIWRNTMEQFKEFTLWKKLVGFGPETIGILLMRKTYGNPYNEIFDSAHNEYLQLLLTVGIAGLVSYVIFILSYIKMCFDQKRDNNFIIAIVFGVICYSVQAFVNLNLPIVTPILWLLLGLGSARSLEK